MYIILSLIFAILGIGFLISFHEFGHFLFCKIFKVDTPTFSVGFGPRLLEKKIGDTTFTLSAIPLGGYVEIAGNREIGQGEQKEASRTDQNSFAHKPYWQKMLIIGGGILFNMIFAYLALSYLYSVGAPGIGATSGTKPPIIATIEPGKPADKAGLRIGDKIISIDGQTTDTIESVMKHLESKTISQTLIKIQRPTNNINNPVEQDISVNLDIDSATQGQKKPRLGIYWYIAPLPLTQALKEGFNATWGLTVQTAKALWSVVATRDTQSIGGPLMLISQVTQSTQLGFKVFLFLLAFISINLAVLNIIPLPIFDGGQALFFTIEALMGRPLSEDTRYKIHYYSWLAVVGLIILLTLSDIHRLTKITTYLEQVFTYIKNLFVK